jgi:PAT family beta-lactamase induction signal transducer AmpG
MLMLARFVPWGVREPTFEPEPPRPRPPLRRSGLVARGLTGAFVGGTVSATGLACLHALERARVDVAGFDIAGAFVRLARPTTMIDAIGLVGVLACAVVSGLFTAAVIAARRSPTSFEDSSIGDRI